MSAATVLTHDIAKATEQSAMGAFLTARQMALKPHSLSKDGMDAEANDGGLWKWSTPFHVWACVATAQH